MQVRSLKSAKDKNKYKSKEIKNDVNCMKQKKLQHKRHCNGK